MLRIFSHAKNGYAGSRLARLEEAALLGIAFTACMIISFNYPGGPSRGEDMITLRNVSSLLFAILSGFFVSFLLNRFTAIRSLLTRESTSLMELYKLAQAFGPEFAGQVANQIDRYLIVRFDADNYFRFTSRGRDALFGLFEELATLENVDTQNLTTMHRQFVATLRDAISLRRETIVTGTITVSRLQWCPLLILAVILIASVFCLKADTPFSSVLSGILAFSILLILYVIKDMSDLNLGGDFLKYETIERVFDFIGKPRYYPAARIPADTVLRDMSHIRIGIGEGRRYSQKIVRTSVEEARQYVRLV